MRKLILLYSICIALFTACGNSVVSPEQIEKYVHLSGLYRGDNTRHDSTYEFLLYGYLL